MTRADVAEIVQAIRMAVNAQIDHHVSLLPSSRLRAEDQWDLLEQVLEKHIKEVV